MIKGGLDNARINPKVFHARGACAPQIMNAPVFEADAQDCLHPGVECRALLSPSKSQTASYGLSC
jgi:hypothetical protein